MTPEETTVQVLILWALALSTLINFVTVIWNIFSGPSKKNGARLDAMAQTMSALDQRVSAMELTQRAMPSKDDIHELELTMSNLRGDMNTMSEAMKGQSAIMARMEAIVARHDNHLLSGKP